MQSFVSHFVYYESHLESIVSPCDGPENPVFYVTLTEKRRQYLAQNDWTGDRYRAWARRIGVNTYLLFRSLKA
jgi:hypothetical protein